MHQIPGIGGVSSAPALDLYDFGHDGDGDLLRRLGSDLQTDRGVYAANDLRIAAGFLDEALLHHGDTAS